MNANQGQPVGGNSALRASAQQQAARAAQIENEKRRQRQPQTNQEAVTPGEDEETEEELTRLHSDI